ncbi:MAG TPA: GNAT family N-acetyltransferase [Ohtaekwangia sp.]|uniref:GNAT family N-acetyltransferase n=1 Tax=Ohtaekwangia sp. TaxID=2066019 RepID=UPI002F952FA1
MAESIIIRKATQDDFPVIYSFINELEETILDQEQQRNIYREVIRQDDYCYLVAETKSEVVGYISCHSQLLLHHGGRVGEIQELFVKAEMRSHGIGKLLVDAIKVWAREKALLQVEVTANVSRTSTHAFYTREGFAHTHKKFVYTLSPADFRRIIS